jgi:hypothetical protein
MEGSMTDLSAFGLTESPAGPPVPPTPCNGGERRININHDKVFSVAIGIYRTEREKYPDAPIEISPTRQGEDGKWDRFRIDRMEATN